jgi:hypothetical protein
VVAEVDVEGDSLRLARRYFATTKAVRLEPVGAALETLEIPPDSVIVLGVIAARLRFRDEEQQPPLEEPLAET